MNAEEPPVNLKALNEHLIACRRCPRLVAWREEVAHNRRRAFQDWDYWGKPVPGFGDPQARLLVVGLAPGAHGSNRTGRMFTGDASGDFLFPALCRAGFANLPTAYRRDDGLALHHLYITAVVRCAPPKNKPAAQEIANCRPYLLAELKLLPHVEGIVALGSIAYDQVIQIFRNRLPSLERIPFSHGAFVRGNGLPWILASYHPSRQNTQTGRLTPAMFDRIWQSAHSLLDGSSDEHASPPGYAAPLPPQQS